MNDIRICSRCVMDTTASSIRFDEKGQCNFCGDLIEKIETAPKNLSMEALVNKIKEDGKGKEYDCIVGVSGGVDSSYTLLKVIELGLRPLAVHLDNGWNSELAVSNITNLITKLNVDLYTHVIDWQENRDMQLAFIKANVLDIEMLMDNAMAALNYQMASRYKLKYILSGTNTATEGMAAPVDWVHYKFDVRNIRAICSKAEIKRIKTHPLMSTLDYIYYRYVKKIEWVFFLDYLQFRKDEALEILKDKVSYKPYPYKHYESVFTRFYQGYILPQKFNIDKRKLHLSTLIVNGEMTRDEALKHFETSPYPDPRVLEQDKEYVIKKLGMTNDSFESYINTPPVPHSAYPSEEWLFKALLKLNSRLKSRG